MAGWNLKSGDIRKYDLFEDEIWSLFNYVFSDSCKKRNSYKYGFLKAILDNIFNGVERSDGVYYSYKQLFAKFAENYWNLVVKYDLRQMRPDGKSVFSKVETILKNAVIGDDRFLTSLEFEMIDFEKKTIIVDQVISECKKCVIGALYEDFDESIYAFDLKSEGLTLNYCFYDFMRKYKVEIENLNYYSWAKFLEKVNDDSALVRVLDKLELATPRRSNLSVYRELLRKEFENTCFYCGKKLQDKKIHVDHFIPWSFVKDDKAWNFVLSCSSCNVKKNNRIPTVDYIVKIEDRNKKLVLINSPIIEMDFVGYSDDLIEHMWKYAKYSGIKEYT